MSMTRDSFIARWSKAAAAKRAKISIGKIDLYKEGTAEEEGGKKRTSEPPLLGPRTVQRHFSMGQI